MFSWKGALIRAFKPLGDGWDEEVLGHHHPGDSCILSR
jgi:hypothetical protein